MQQLLNENFRERRHNKGSIGLVFVICLGLGLAFILGKEVFPRFFNEKIVIEKDLAEERYYSTFIKTEDLYSKWEPGDYKNSGSGPEVMAELAVLIDVNSGKILFEKNALEVRPIASLVKIMTGIVALEHKGVEEEIIVSENAAEIGENIMGISAGEVYTLEELLYGLMLNSGNDAAHAIAEGVGGDVETFTKWMNIKAKELNLNDSYFGCPSGLFDGTRSTPIDLVKLSRYAMQNEKFREIVKTYELEFPYSEKHKYIYLWNQTNLLTTYPGVEGIKTGYTEEAGLCLITYAKNENVELIGVVLNSVDRKGDMIMMLDYAFEKSDVSIEHNLLGY